MFWSLFLVDAFQVIASPRLVAYSLIRNIGIVLAIYTASLMANLLAPALGGRRDFPQATRTLTYALIPLWLGSLLIDIACVLAPRDVVQSNLVRWTGSLCFHGLWLVVLYHLSIALPLIMRCKSRWAWPYSAAIFATFIAFNALTGFVSPYLQPIFEKGVEATLMFLLVLAMYAAAFIPG